jgi:hypothetical protein
MIRMTSTTEGREMKNQRLLVALTVVNLGLLAFQLVRPRLDLARETGPVLRGRALELVDERGKVRAEIRVFPADPTHKLPGGDPYPETVLLRLIDPNGRPSVKLATDVRGGGLYLGGAEDPTMVQLGAQGAEARLKLVNDDRQEKVIRP